MPRIILADQQMIFRTGVNRVLSVEADMQVVAQCADIARLREALVLAQGEEILVLFPSSFVPDPATVLDLLATVNARAIMVVEHGTTVDEEIVERVQGMVLRSVSAIELVETIRRVAQSQRVILRESVRPAAQSDRVGNRVLERLTPKEVQIVALVGEGYKNREIAERLGTKEQVVKNYLRSIYDKTGVSDRLELALFTVHHRALAEAAQRALTRLVRAA
ncbi:MAG: response regulator transcription factor [Bryocella sp.]